VTQPRIQPAQMDNLELLRAIHRVCNQFEALWGTSSAVSIEQLLEKNPTLEREALLCALIRAELEILGEAGASLRIEEYRLRFPQEAAVDRAFQLEDQIEGEVPPHSPSAEVLRLTRARSLDVTPLVPRTDGIHAPFPNQLGPYEILHEIARGGMGIVYRARHVDLQRHVALKVILAGHMASNVELARFRHETRAIAALDHPGVVPIYDVGESAGYQYFAMPLIEGANLADLIADRPLPPREAATLVAKIAEAIEFAHRQGIIHRDLKPRNILLDHQGQPRVTDFGLAKLAVAANSSSDNNMSLSGPTGTGQVLGTPSYMAPEQARGEADSVTLLADVYSLGALFYALLTGRPPFQAATPVETVRQVIDREPVAPRKLNPLIPRDLETIILKCLDKSPPRRYSSAAALASDVNRYLSGVPIAARRISFWARGWRSAQRQPVVAGLLLIVLTSIIGGGATATRFYFQARHNAQEADKNFTYAQDAVREYLAAVGSSPELKVEGLESLRRKLISTARDFYARLAEDKRGASASRIDLAHALKDLGQMDTDLNDQASALQHYQAMDGIWEQLVREEPGNPEYQRWWSNSQMLIGVMHKSQGNVDEATRCLESAYKIRAKLIQSYPNERIYRIEWANMIVNLWDHASRLDRKEEVERWLQEATELCRVLRDEPGTDIMVEQTFVTSLTGLGAAYFNRGDASKSLEFFAAARDLAQRVTEELPEDPDRQLDLARCHLNMAQILPILNRVGEARTAFSEASRIFEKLASEHPLVGDYRYGLAINTMNLGALEFNLQKWDDAEAAFVKTSELLQELHTQAPDNFTYRLDRAQSWSNLGNTAFMREKFDEAERWYSDSISEHKKLIDEHPLDISISASLEATRGNLAQVYTRAGRNQEAIATMREILQAQVDLAAKQPAEVSAHRRMIGSRINLMGMLHDEQAWDEAESMGRTAVRDCDKFMELHPELEEGRGLQSFAQYLLGITLSELDRLDEADMAFVAAQDLRENILAAGDQGTEVDDAGIHRFELARILFQRGEVEKHRNQTEAALDYYLQATKIAQLEIERRATGEGDIISLSDILIQSRCGAARAFYSLFRLDAALVECELGLKLTQGKDLDDLHAIRARIWARQGETSRALEELPTLVSPDKRTSWRLVDEAATHALVAKHLSTSDPAIASSQHKEALRLLELAKSRRQKTFEFARSTSDFEGLRPVEVHELGKVLEDD
jgi:eukaryotic-like serine/threonine-protein kinase